MNKIVGVTGYEISQELDGTGRIEISFLVINHGGDGQIYADFVKDVQEFVRDRYERKTAAAQADERRPETNTSSAYHGVKITVEK